VKREKDDEHWVEKPVAVTTEPGSGAVATPVQLLRLAGYPTAGLTYPGGPTNPLPAPPPARPVATHNTEEDERRRKLQSLAGYGREMGYQAGPGTFNQPSQAKQRWR
jgi:hypothetical protein